MDQVLEIVGETLSDWGNFLVGLPHEKFFASLILLLFYLAVRRFVVRPLSLRFSEAQQRYSAQKWSNAALTVFGVILLGVIWIDAEAAKTLQFAGFISAGLLIALQEPISNFFGWVYIVLRSPFDLQDRIQIGQGGVAGDVIDIRLFSFSMLEIGNWVDADQSTGRIVHIPNGVVFKRSIANYTQGFHYIWNEIGVTVTFESDWDKAHKILTEIAYSRKEDLERAEREVRETSTQYMVYYTRLTPIVWIRVAEQGVTLTMRHLVDARRRRGIETEIWREVLKRFATESDIDFAYPTQRFYDNRMEGKPGAGGMGTPPTTVEMIRQDVERDD